MIRGPKSPVRAPVLRGAPAGVGEASVRPRAQADVKMVYDPGDAEPEDRALAFRAAIVPVCSGGRSQSGDA